MKTIEWWPLLDGDAQAWLIAHNGDAVSTEVLSKIVAAGGSLTSDAWWIGEAGTEGFYLSDEAVDWIEATANDESA
ncbi:hypothetical protein [Microbacterium terregens]|jgi:hypothetical protein|uniref:Uncharacterized protein n=1 Tax=Microbacterium terregens TaxID=69363 RepID=A0ABV5SVW0_9MICO